jgi:hypothetical protein
MCINKRAEKRRKTIVIKQECVFIYLAKDNARCDIYSGQHALQTVLLPYNKQARSLLRCCAVSPNR